MVVAEAYPDLKASKGFHDLQFQLEGTENRVTAARTDYIEAVRDYNTAIQKVPGSLVAGFGDFTPAAQLTIEESALRVFREWKLGAVGKNDGALLVVAAKDREMRIEVGRGLEGDLPDAICGRIIDDVLTPRFQKGDFAGGLRAGVEALQRAA